MTSPSPRPLLLVGVRRAVLPAVRRLGRPTYALLGQADQASMAAELAGVRVVDLHGPREALEGAARELLDGREPAAVVALAERTVLAAARLRGAFGLPGTDETRALRCADKVEMKRAMEAAGVPVARWRAVEPGVRASELVEALGLPVVLKPRRDSGGRGQRVLRSAAELDQALAELPELSFGWLAEGWVEGVEMSVEAFVRDGAVQFVNPTEYLVPRHANVVPAALDPATLREVLAFDAAALRAVGIDRGITHLELFRTSQGMVFGELAARPPGGRLMPLIQRAWGFDPWEALLRLELGEPFEFPSTPRRVAGVWVLHPGEGTVARVASVEEARALPLVRRVTVRVAPGDRIAPREGSGQDVGSIQVEGPDRDAVAAALQEAHGTLRLEVR